MMFVLIVGVSAGQCNPLGKVSELISALEAMVIKEGEKNESTFEEFFELRDSTSQNLINEIKNEGALRDATAIRGKDAAYFAASEKELMAMARAGCRCRYSSRLAPVSCQIN